MSEAEVKYYYIMAFTGMSIIAMAIMACIALINPILEQKKKFRFFSAFILVLLNAMVDASLYYLEHRLVGGLITLEYIINYIGFMLTPLAPILLARILKNENKQYYVYYVYITYAIVYLILTATGHAFVINPNGTYERCIPGFTIYVLFTSFSMLYLLASTVILWKKMLSTHPIILFVLFFFLMAGMCAQIIEPALHVVVPISGIACIVFYTYTVSLANQMDGLTGLFSHYTFLSSFRQIKEGEALFVLDCNDFKEINDKYGHVEGDKVLLEIAKIIQSEFKKIGRCYRMGGDEFCVIVNAGQDFDALVNKFIDRIENEKDKVHVNVSIGYAVHKKGSHPTETVDLADKNMYECKLKQKQIQTGNI